MTVPTGTRKGVPHFSVMRGPHGGKFYINAQGHKVYGEPSCGTTVGGVRASKGRSTSRYAPGQSRAAWNQRPHRESLSKTIGKMKTTQIRDRDGDKCCFCQRHKHELERSTFGIAGAANHLSLDHCIRPKSEGGKENVKNLLQACAECNSIRHNWTLEEWARRAPPHLRKFTAAGIRKHLAQPVRDYRVIKEHIKSGKKWP
jgi:hypothetical protein